MKLLSTAVAFAFGALLISCNRVKTPIPCIEIDQQTVAAGDTIIFTSCSENELSYIWRISGPDSASENGLQWNDRVFKRALTVPGSYKVKLTVYNDFSWLGESASDSTNITVN